MMNGIWSRVIRVQSVMKMCVLFMLIGLCSQLTALTTFERTYGGFDSDKGYGVEQTSDQGYIIVGSTWSYGAGQEDIYVIKTDSLGDTLWTKTYGGTDWERGRSIQQTLDGGYIIGGWTQSFGSGVSDVYLIKTDASGDTIWTRTYGGTSADDGYYVRQTSDGGFIAVGRTNSYGAGDFDVYLVKTDASGNTMWTNTFGSTYIDWGICVQQTSDQGYIVVGMNGSLPGGDVYLIRTDSLGDSLWTRTYGGGNSDRGYFVSITQDEGYIITGETSTYGAGGIDVYLIKTDSLGNPAWTQTYGASNTEAGLSVQEIQDGYIIAGRTNSFGAGELDIYLIKTNSTGDTIWTRTYGGATYDWGFSVQQALDGGYIVAGYTQSFGAGSDDVYLIKTDQNGMVGVEEEPIIGFIEENDHSSTTIISGPLLLPKDKKCKIIDITGRFVESSEITRGIYFIEVDGKVTRKVVKVR